MGGDHRSRDVAMVIINFMVNRKISISHLHSAHRHSTTDWRIATLMGALTPAMFTALGRVAGQATH